MGKTTKVPERDRTKRTPGNQYSRQVRRYLPPVEQADALIKFVYLQMAAQGLSRADVAKGSNGSVAGGSLKDWANGRRDPQLSNIRAVLGFLGYGLKPVPLPPKEKPHA